MVVDAIVAAATSLLICKTAGGKPVAGGCRLAGGNGRNEWAISPYYWEIADYCQISLRRHFP